MLPETLDSALKPLQRAMGICGHLGSSSHAHKKLPALNELRDDLLHIFSKMPSMMLVIDGGDAKFCDGRTGACYSYRWNIHDHQQHFIQCYKSAVDRGEAGGGSRRVRYR
jgi:hypothetical protein